MEMFEHMKVVKINNLIEFFDEKVISFKSFEFSSLQQMYRLRNWINVLIFMGPYITASFIFLLNTEIDSTAVYSTLTLLQLIEAPLSSIV